MFLPTAVFKKIEPIAKVVCQLHAAFLSIKSVA